LYKDAAVKMETSPRKSSLRAVSTRRRPLAPRFLAGDAPIPLRAPLMTATGIHWWTGGAGAVV
jgi:hypothetical protein